MCNLRQLKVMQVSAPSVYASLYLWGQGHTTSEGEKIPVRMDAMECTYPARIELLLPVVIEHAIDERSPLYGHTHDSLVVCPALFDPHFLDVRMYTAKLDVRIYRAKARRQDVQG
jgi:hypothetical protein